MDFAERMIARSESRRKEFEEHLRALQEGGMLGDEEFKAVISMTKKKMDEEDNKENSSQKSHLSRAAHERHKKLAALYSDDSAGPSSPVYKPHDRFSPNSRNDDFGNKELRASARDRLAAERAKRLAALAKNINDWEDESDKKVHFKSTNEKVIISKPVLKESVSSSQKFTKVPPQTQYTSKAFTQTQQSSRPATETQQPPRPSTETQRLPRPTTETQSSLSTTHNPQPSKPNAPLQQTSKPQMQTPKTPKAIAEIIAPKETTPSSAEVIKDGWDRKMIQSLEAQGYQRCESQQHLIFDYKSPKHNPAECSTIGRRSGSPVKDILKSLEAKSQVRSVERQSVTPAKIVEKKSVSPVKTIPKENETSPVKKYISPKIAVLELAARYEETSPTKKVKDPTELSIMDRKAIFEKNKGGAILPKAPFGMPVPTKILAKPNETTPLTPVQVKAPEKTNTNAKVLAKPNETTPLTPVQVKAPEKTNTNVKTPNMRSKTEWPKANQDEQPRDNVAESILERKREIEELKNRWEKKKAAFVATPDINESSKVPDGSKMGIPKPPPMPAKQSSPSKRNWSRTMNPVEERSPIPKPPPMPSQSSSPKRIKMGVLSPVRHTPVSEQTLSPIERNDFNFTTQSRRKSDGYPVLAEVKPIKVSPPKPGRIYPSVSDIETESEVAESEVPESDFDLKESEGSSYSSDSEQSSMSLGQAIVEASRISKTSLKRPSTSSDTIYSENVSEQESRIIHEMEDFLDEALGEASPPKKSRDSLESEIERGLSSYPSGSTRCDSFEFSMDSTEDESTKKNDLHLEYSVSIYRKQAPTVLTTPIRREVRIEEPKRVERKTVDRIPEEILVKQRIKELECEMVKQTTIISQASQALNLCHSRIEFSGSPEQVEAEKLLLLATQRRTAAVHEIERLKVENRLSPNGNGHEIDRGDLIIEQITLPVKPFPCGRERVDNFVCLATCGATVLATPCQPAVKGDSKIIFAKPLKFEKLYPNFTITVEVYRLSSTPTTELIPHDIKYGINHSGDRKKDRLRLTPQKKSAKTQRLIESPGGPNAVRSPAFQLMGFAVFSLREVNRTKFTLSKVPYGAPLEGSLEIQMSTQLQTNLVYKGFLTIFEEVSGFGAWRRRWGVLSGSMISLWSYPEYENEQIPLDTIDLSHCHNREVGLVSREICARPHTFLLEIVGGTRYLISADTVEDRIGWCNAINKSLCLLSAWGNRQNS